MVIYILLLQSAMHEAGMMEVAWNISVAKATWL
jgi:hypothetical protein